MAKGKRKRGRKQRGAGGPGAAGAMGGAFWAQLIRETLGNFAGQLMADGAEQMGRGGIGEGDDVDGPQDVAADVLCALAESKEKSIADLITETGAGLTSLLSALRQAREFGLLTTNEDGSVQLTPSGVKTASALRREQINSDGMKLLES